MNVIRFSADLITDLPAGASHDLKNIEPDNKYIELLLDRVRERGTCAMLLSGSP